MPPVSKNIYETETGVGGESQDNWRKSARPRYAIVSPPLTDSVCPVM